MGRIILLADYQVVMRKIKKYKLAALALLVCNLTGCSLFMFDSRFPKEVAGFERDEPPYHWSNFFRAYYKKKSNNQLISQIEYSLTEHETPEIANQRIEESVNKLKLPLKQGALTDLSGKEIGRFKFFRYLYKYWTPEGGITRKTVFCFSKNSWSICLTTSNEQPYPKSQSYKPELTDVYNFAKALPFTKDINFPSIDDIPDALSLDHLAPIEEPEPEL